MNNFDKKNIDSVLKRIRKCRKKWPVINTEDYTKKKNIKQGKKKREKQISKHVWRRQRKLEKRNKNRIHSMSQKKITATNEKLNRTNRKTHEKDEKHKRNCSLQKNTFLKLN